MYPNASRLIRLLALACATGAAVFAAHAQSGDEGKKSRPKSERHESHEREKHSNESVSALRGVGWLLTMHGHDGKPQGVWGLTDSGELKGPLSAAVPDGPAGLVPHDLRGLARLPDGGFLAMNSYIKDTRILRFGACDASGLFPYMGDFAKAGPDDPALAHGYQIAIAGDGKVYASNQDSSTVSCYAGVGEVNPGAPLGVVVRSGKSIADGVKDVRGIVFGPDGLLHVCDRGAGCVSAYDPGSGRRVKLVAESRHGLKRPIQAIFTGDGATMFIGDNGANCVFKVDVASGRVDEFIAKGKAGLTEPSALAIHDGWLYVASREDKRILRFRLADGEADGKPFATLPDEPEFLLRIGG